MSARLGMKRSGSAVRGGVLVPEHGEVVVVLTYNDDDDPVLLVRWLRTGDCGGLVTEDDNAGRVPRDFLGDNGAPRSEIMVMGWVHVKILLKEGHLRLRSKKEFTG